MRIIHVSTIKQHPCFSDVVSLQAQRHEVIFILLNLSDDPQYRILSKYDEYGIKYIQLSVHKDFDFSSDSRLEAIFSKIVKAFDPDILHIQLFTGVNVRSILKACSELRVRKIITQHIHSLFCLPGVCFDKGKVCPLNSLQECSCESCQSAAQVNRWSLSQYNQIRESRLKEIVAWTDIIICCSRWQENTIQRLVGQGSKTVVLYYGVKIPRRREKKLTITRPEIEAAGIDWKNFKSNVVKYGLGEKASAATIRLYETRPANNFNPREVFGADDKKLEAIIHKPLKKIRKKSSVPVFGYIGTLWNLKGIDILLDSIQQNRDQAFRVLMGIFDKASTADAAQLKMIKMFPQVEIILNIPRQDLYEKFYSQIDYLIIPSVWEETGPMTLFEAFYYKIPVIISKRPSMIEKTIEGVNALVFDGTRTLGGIMKDIIEARVTPAIKSRANFPVKTIKEYAAILEKIYSGKLLIPKLEHE